METTTKINKEELIIIHYYDFPLPKEKKNPTTIYATHQEPGKLEGGP